MLFYGYYHQEDIEVKKKSDIEDYIEYLKRNGVINYDSKRIK